MKEMRQDRLAFDLKSARTFDEGSGHMHVAQTNISQATVNRYNGDEIPGWKELGLDPDRVYRLLRHPEELQKAAASFNGKPLVMVHRAQSANDHDHQNRVGSVGNATYDHPFLKADLAVWAKEAIDAIESGEQRELSCGYHYTPDMTPGEFEGEKYDGVMRGLGGNHVALVKEGRAGPACHVFDSLETIRMTKTVLSRKAAVAQGALVAYLAPKMAQDAKIDWTPTFKDVTSKNYKDKKAAIAADALKQLKGKLAKDENVQLEQIAAVLEAVASVDPVEPAPPVAGADPVTEDDEDAPMRAVLKEMGILDDDIEKALAKAKGGASAQDDAPANMGTASASEFEGSGSTSAAAGGGSTRTYAPASGGSGVGSGGAGEAEDEEDDEGKKDKDKKAMDAKLNERLKGMVSKQAHDAALTQVRKDAAADAIKTQREIFEALNFVKPWVGELPIAMDSAEEVYRSALAAREISDTDGLPVKAMKMILSGLPKPGEERRPSSTRLAQDAAAASGFVERYPDAARVRLL